MAIQRRRGFIPRKNYLGQVNEAMIRQELLKNQVDPKLVEAISRSMVSVFRKLAPDERLNYEVIENEILNPTPPPRFATILVESSDTVNSGSNGADFTIPTTDDASVSFALARDAAENGKIVVLDGTYNFASSVLMNDQYTHLQGMGPGTIFNTSAGQALHLDSDYIDISDIAFTGVSGITFEDCDYADIRNCVFRDLSGHGVQFAGGVATRRRILVHHNRFKSVVSPINAGAQSGPSDVVISDNYFYLGGTTAVIYFTGGARILIVGNYMQDPTGMGIKLQGAFDVQINDNYIYAPSTGIELGLSTSGFSCTECLVDGNFIYGASATGIDLSSTGNRRIEVCNNYLKDNNTYGIGVVGDDHFVHGNKVYGTSHDYAIAIVNAASDNNLVINNDLKGGWTTAAFLDTGTGTLYNLDGSANNWNRQA